MRLSILLALLAGHAAAAQTPADTLDFSDVTPEIVGGLAGLQQTIVYPAADRDAGRQGTVILRFVVTAAGAPAAVRVVRGVSPGLDSAAVAGVRAARFVPGREDGVPVNVRMAIPIRFSITRPEPRPELRRGLDADTLLGRLGWPWTLRGLPAPSLTEGTADGQRLTWTRPDAETERVTVDVVGDTMRVLTLVAAEGSSAIASVQQIADAVAAARVAPGTDGFLLATDLGINGIPFRADLALDLANRTWRLRAPACRPAVGGPCWATPPVLVGGIRGLQESIRYPREALETMTSGTVYARTTLAADGRVVSVESLRRPSGPAERALQAEAMRALGASRWIPATTRGGQPVETHVTVPVRFTIRD